MIRYQYGRMLQDGLDGAHGLSRAQLADLVQRFGAVQDEVRARRGQGEYHRTVLDDLLIGESLSACFGEHPKCDRGTRHSVRAGADELQSVHGEAVAAQRARCR